MNLDKALESRRSIRNYSKKQVSWHHLSEILNAATFSPSSGNLQNWRFIVVSDKKKKKEISTACLKQTWMESAPVLIVICADYSSIKLYFPGKYEELSLQNCAIAANNIMLKATELGLSSCYVSILDDNAVSRTLKLKTNIKPMVIVTLGYSNEKPEGKKINSLQNLVHFEEYGKKRR